MLIQKKQFSGLLKIGEDRYDSVLASIPYNIISSSSKFLISLFHIRVFFKWIFFFSECSEKIILVLGTTWSHSDVEIFFKWKHFSYPISSIWKKKLEYLLRIENGKITYIQIYFRKISRTKVSSSWYILTNRQDLLIFIFSPPNISAFTPPFLTSTKGVALGISLLKFCKFFTPLPQFSPCSGILVRVKEE